MEKKKTKTWKKALIILTIIIAILIVAFIAYKTYVQIDIEIRYKEFAKRPEVEAKEELTYKEDENIAEAEKADYIIQDDIGVKVDSLSITDTTFNANINIKLNKELDKNFNYKTLGFGYAVYDESGQIYEINSRMHIGETEKYDYNALFMQRELIKTKSKDIYDIYLSDSAGIGSISIDEEENIIINKIEINAKDQFPQSKKIYIKIFDLGYFNVNKNENGEPSAQNFNLSDAKWLFEFDIPEEMNERKTVNLQLANTPPGLVVTKMIITENKLVLNFGSKEYIELISAGKDMPAGEFPNKQKEMLNITDGEGKTYQDIGGGTTKNNGYKISFDATTKDLSKKLFLNFKIGDTQYISEIIEK